MNCRRFKENLTSLKLLSCTSSSLCGMKLSFTKLFQIPLRKPTELSNLIHAPSSFIAILGAKRDMPRLAQHILLLNLFHRVSNNDIRSR